MMTQVDQEVVPPKKSSVIIEELTTDEYNKILQSKNVKYNPFLIRRVFIFGLSMLSLVVILYILLISYPAYALGSSVVVISVMCGCLIFFVWNEMTYHHHTLEKGEYEYHKTPTNIISNNNDEEVLRGDI